MKMRVKKPRARKTKAVKTVGLMIMVWACAGEEATIVMDADVAVKADLDTGTVKTL